MVARYCSNNYRDLLLDRDSIPALTVKDITGMTTHSILGVN
jgi:hypothetical protein